MTVTKLPNGELCGSHGEVLSGWIRADERQARARRTWLDRLARINPRLVLSPVTWREEDDRISWTYGEDSAGTTPLTDVIDEWRRAPAPWLPRALELASFLVEVQGELDRVKLPDPLIGPAWIRWVTIPSGHFRLLAWPGQGITLADWAQSDPGTWIWFPPEALLGQPTRRPWHTLGAAVHHALVGDLFPRLLPRGERFARLIRGRVGDHERLEMQISDAIPPLLCDRVATLTSWVVDALSPSPMSWPEAVRRLDEIRRALMPPALIQAWDAAGRPEVVRQIEALGAPPLPNLPAPPLDQPWHEVAEARLKQGDFEGALNAAWLAMRNHGPFAARLYLRALQGMTRDPGVSHPRLTEALGRLAQLFPLRPAAPRTAGEPKALEKLLRPAEPTAGLDEADVLRMLDLKARLQGLSAKDRQVLAGSFESNWNQAMACLLLASEVVRRADGASDSHYSDASRLCKKARDLIRKQPNGGGPVGRYALAYLDLLDGVAHVHAIGRLVGVEYCRDAARCFFASLAAASELGVDGLVRTNLAWLKMLQTVARCAPGQTLQDVDHSIAAVLHAHLYAPDTTTVAWPTLPWYDPEILFPI